MLFEIKYEKNVSHLAKDCHSPNFLCILRYEVTANHCYEDNNLFEITFFYPTVPLLILTPCGAIDITGFPSSPPTSIAIISNLSFMKRVLMLNETKCIVRYLNKASFCCLRKGHVYEGSGERLCVHLAARPLQVLNLPLLHVGAGGARPHCEQVGHHAAEPRRQAGLGYEAKLELCLENNIKTSHCVDIVR